MSEPGRVLTKPTEQKSDLNLVPVTFSTLGMETKKQTARAGTFRKNLLSSANVLRGDTLLARPSANKKRVLDRDREVAVTCKELKVFQ